MKESIYKKGISTEIILQKILNLNYYSKSVYRHNLSPKTFCLYVDNYFTLNKVLHTFTSKSCLSFGKSIFLSNYLYKNKSLKSYSFNGTFLKFLKPTLTYINYLSSIFFLFLTRNKYKRFFLLNPIKGGYRVYSSLYKTFLKKSEAIKFFAKVLLVFKRTHKIINNSVYSCLFFKLKNIAFIKPYFLLKLPYAFNKLKRLKLPRKKFTFKISKLKVKKVKFRAFYSLICFTKPRKNLNKFLGSKIKNHIKHEFISFFKFKKFKNYKKIKTLNEKVKIKNL